MSHFCEECLLVQLEEFVRLEEIFTEYAYFSSCINTWLQHARDYTDLMGERFALDPQSRVVEVASNDGYLLQYFAKKHIPVLRIGPAVNVALQPSKSDFQHGPNFLDRRSHIISCENLVSSTTQSLIVWRAPNR